ncbi:hypothetical protein ALC62_04579, partial [Cyphomyrmex costatus]
KAALNYIIHDEKRVSCRCDATNTERYEIQLYAAAYKKIHGATLNRVTPKSYFRLARERATWRAARPGLVSVMKRLHAGKQAGRQAVRQAGRGTFIRRTMAGLKRRRIVMGERESVRGTGLIGAGMRFSRAAKIRSGVLCKGRPRSVRKENIYEMFHLFSGRGASRVTEYWLAYNVRPNVVKLTQNYVQNSCEAQARNSSQQPPHLVALQILLLMWMH